MDIAKAAGAKKPVLQQKKIDILDSFLKVKIIKYQISIWEI